MVTQDFERNWNDYQQTGSFVALLIFLQNPLAEAVDFAGVRGKEFPVSGLIEFAMSKYVSSYWADLAVGWLEQGAGIDNVIAKVVDEMVAEKRTTQRTRHRAFRLVRRWERGNAA